MPPPPLRNSTTQKRSAKWVFIFLAIPALACLAVVFIRARVHFRAKARMEAVRSAKLPTSGAELAKWVPPVTDARNGALVITQAFALMKDFPDARSNIFMVTNLLRTNFWSKETRAVIHDYFETNATALAKVREGLAFPEFRYPVHYEETWSAILPHLPKIRHLCSVMAIEAVLAAEERRTDEWKNSLVDAVRLAETLNREPLLISQLVRISALRTACRATERSLRVFAPPLEDSKKLQDMFLKAAETNLLPMALIAERANTIPMFDISFDELMRMTNPDGEGADEADLNVAQAAYRTIGAVDRDRIFYLDTMERAIAIAQQGLPRRLELTNHIQAASQTAKSRLYIVTGIFLPAVGKAAVRFATGQAVVRMAATALAVDRFRQTRGALPKELKELTPEFMETEPIDPFDGKPLRYRTEGRDYRVYSVGEDGIDDNGREPPARRNPRDHSTHDLVFAIEH